MILLIDSSAFYIKYMHSWREIKKRNPNFQMKNMLYCSVKLIDFVKKLGLKRSDCVMVYESIPLHELNPRRKISSKYKECNLKRDLNLSYRFSCYMKKQHFKVAPSPGNMEADDMIGLICEKAPRNQKISILTSDKDLFQVISENVSVLLLKKDNQLEEVDLPAFKKMYKGLEPWMFKYYKALKGDVNDCYKGVDGIGSLSALKLVRNAPLDSDDPKEREEQMFSYISDSLKNMNKNVNEFKVCLKLARLYPQFIKNKEKYLKELGLVEEESI